MIAAVETDVTRALERAAVYRLLARSFSYPTPSLLDDVGWAAATAAIGPAVGPSLRLALAELSGAARRAEAETLAEEFVRLFHRDVRCPPYEGAYGLAPQMAGKASTLADIAGFYTAFGLAASATAAETEDHIGAELEFMSALALKHAHALAGDDADGVDVIRGAEAAFARDHLGAWGLAFAAELAGTATTPFYASAAKALDAWLQAEIDRFHVAPPAASRLAASPGDAEAFVCPLAAPAEDEAADVVADEGAV